MTTDADTAPEEHIHSFSDDDQQQDLSDQAASTGCWESQEQSPKSLDKSSPRCGPCSPRGRIGRPVKHDKDINNPALTEVERRKIRRRTANRMSARRVRDRRAHKATDLEATIGRAAAENQMLLNQISNAESECLAASQQLSDFHEKLVGLNSSNMRLHCRQALMRNFITQAHQQRSLPKEMPFMQAELSEAMPGPEVPASMASPEMSPSMQGMSAPPAQMHLSAAPAPSQPHPNQSACVHHPSRTSWVRQDMSEGVPQAAAAAAAYTSSSSDQTAFPGLHGELWAQPDCMHKLASFNLDDGLTASLDFQYSKEGFQGS